MNGTSPDGGNRRAKGQAAYEAFYTAFGGTVPDWPPIGMEGGREAWEAVETAIEARKSEVAAARSDRLENLAVEWGKRAKVARNRSAQTAGRTAERYDECADMLEHCAAGLRRAAGFSDGTPAVATSGTEWLAKEIRDLAIPG